MSRLSTQNGRLLSGHYTYRGRTSPSQVVGWAKLIFSTTRLRHLPKVKLRTWSNVARSQTSPLIFGGEKVLGPEHSSTLDSMDNLALVLTRQGKYEAAEKVNVSEIH
jgi:hypothetical protein